MELTLVQSSNLRSVGYDPVKNILWIKFKDNSLYEYRNVPESIYRDLMAASSKGKYLWSHIRDVYPCGRVR